MSKDYYIWLDGMEIPVSEEVYRIYKLAKPFLPTELVARVKANFAQYARLTATRTSDSVCEIEVGDIKINIDTRRVYVGGIEIELKNKEYELLNFLITNVDIVFSKETLYERIWGMDALGDIKTVAVHINWLREKIEQDVSNPIHIQTVWGAGYRFRA